MATSRLERIGTILTRQDINENLLKNLEEVVNNLEVDYNALKENEQKLEYLTSSFLKCIQQATAAHKQKLKAVQEIHATFQKEVEGLILRGAMKPDDRPLWFDVYKAFPPTVEPKFARTQPENQPIRPILYKEDNMRVKFQSKGHGITANLLSPSGETYTKRLIHKYQQLKLEGVTEDELVEKSVAAVASERKTDTNSNTPKNPDSLASSILSDANIHNIFKEQ